MTVLELKKYIFENEKIEYILNEIGCGNVTYHANKEYWSCSNYDGDNKTAINVFNNEYLNVRNYTRKFDEQSDLITLVEYNKKLSFIDAIKYLHKILGLKCSITREPEKKEEKIDPLYIFKKVKNRKRQVNVLEFNTLCENELNDFVPMVHIDWFREGIMPWTVKKFGLAYSYKYKRNVVPLRYWLTGELLGFNMRTTVENYDLFDIKKYFITPGYPKQLNLFGLWENKDEIQKAGYVVVYESEKSVLKRDSLNDPTGVAVSGHEISDEQAKILIGLNVEIIIAFDKDIDINHIRHCCEKFYGIRKVSYIQDAYDLLGDKDCIADKENKLFEFFMEYRKTYDESEHRKYIKSLERKGA